MRCIIFVKSRYGKEKKMYEDELRRVEKKIDKMAAENRFAGVKTYVFGVSDHTRQIIRRLRSHNIEPAGIIDNDPSKQSGYCAGTRVMPFNDLGNALDQDHRYVIYSPYWREMLGQLKHAGVKKKNILLLYKRKKGLARLMCEASAGRLLYGRLVKKYGNLPVFVCPYTGTGDIYLIGTFWNAYCAKNSIHDYIFIVISKACEKTAMLFGIKNIVVLKKQKEAAELIRAHMLWPDEIPMKLLNDCWGQIHSNQIEWFRGFKGLNFTTMFRRYVFDLDETVKPQHPKDWDAGTKSASQFERAGLPVGKTVVLSPYSNTLLDLPGEFWAQLADRLKEKGYAVCTNTSGPMEPVVPGTEAVFFPLDTAPWFLDQAGYFVGVRSGLCDIISGSSARKIILYDAQNRFYKGSAYEYFSLIGMELCGDAVEIPFDRNNKHRIMERILDCL